MENAMNTDGLLATNTKVRKTLDKIKRMKTHTGKKRKKPAVHANIFLSQHKIYFILFLHLLSADYTHD